MADEPGGLSTWAFRLAVFGGAGAGLALILAAAFSADAPVWWWIAGVPLFAAFGSLACVWTAFRLRHRSPRERQRMLADLSARQDAAGRSLDRSRIAHQATKHKKAVLRSGTDATAVVRFLADGHRANQFKQLVYLELEVTAPGRQPYLVKTGEYLTAASTGSMTPGRTLHVKFDQRDPTRIAVDWDRSLRLGE